MKPSKYDIKVKMLISGEELSELKRQTWQMVEAFGLNRRIEQYSGKRPIGFYRWDIECLLDVIEMTLSDSSEYPDKNSTGYKAMSNLLGRLQKEYRENYDITDI